MFDMPSVLFSMFVVKATMAVILLSFWVTRFRADGLPEMSISMTLGALWAFAGIVVVDTSNYTLAVLPLTLICTSDMLAARAIRRLQQRPVRRQVEIAVLVFSFLGVSYFSAVRHSIPDSLSVTSVASAVVSAFAARDLLTENRPSLRTSCRILGAAFGVWALFHAVLIVVRPLYGGGERIADQIVWVDYVVAFMNMTVAITWSLGFLWATYGNAQFRLRAAYDELDRFSGAVAHDLKAPLTAIIGNLEAFKYLPDSGDPAGKQRFLDNACEGAARMNTFINDLLEHARTVQSDPGTTRIDPNTCVKSVTTTLAHQIAEVGATVTAGSLPPVRANALQFSRVILNLLDNALKYRSPDRPPRVTITGRVIGGTAEIAVTDNGCGIPEDDRARIFTRFVRPQGNVVGGDGIGLSECRLILERYQGTISVESKLGEGSVFTIRLPAAE